MLGDKGWDVSVVRAEDTPEHYVAKRKDKTERALHAKWRGSYFSLWGRVGETIVCGYCDAEWGYEADGPNGEDPAQHKPGCPCPGTGDNPGTSAQSEIAFAWARAQRR